MANKFNSDIILIGAGIMSATLGMLLRQLQPGITIHIIERLDSAAAESSDAWNNAGTGHSAFCELNYTPEKKDGTVEITKALKIAESFEVSRELWSYLVEKEYLPDPTQFISQVPHISFVWGEKNVEYLRKRYAGLQTSPLFKGMKWSEDREEIAQWAPIVMRGRDTSTPVAATRMEIGT